MRLQSFILFVSIYLFLFSCTKPISKDFVQEVNAVLVQERDAARADYTFDEIHCSSTKEQQILEVIKRVKNTKQRAAGQTIVQNDTEKILLEADSQSTHIGNPSLMMWTKTHIGYYYYRLTELEKALPYFLEASKYLSNPKFEAVFDPVDCLIKNAYFFSSIGDHQLAVDNLKHALQAKFIGTKDTAILHYSLGFEYHLLEDDAESKKYYQLAKVGSENRDPIRYAKTLGELALFELQAGDTSKAEEFLRKDIELSNLHGDERNSMFAQIRLSQLYIDMQRWEEAKNGLQAASNYAAERENLLGFQQEIILANLKIYQHYNNPATQLDLLRDLRRVEEQLKHTDGAAAIMKVNVNLLRERSEWDRLAHESKLQKSNLTGLALFIICTLLIVLALSLRSSKLKSLQLQQSEFEHKITAIELDKFKSDNKYEQAQHTIKSYLTFIDERNVAIDHLKDEVAKLESATSETSVEQRSKLKDLLSEHLMSEENWFRFKRVFIVENRQFYNHVVHQLVGITESQLRIVLLQKVGVSNHEMANLLGVGLESIRKAKQRLRKKYGDQYDQCFHTVTNPLLLSDPIQ